MVWKTKDYIPEEPPHHDKAEIVAAVESLTTKSIQEMVRCAMFRVLGTRGRANEDDAIELLQEAVAKTLAFERKWRRGITFRNHLLACMRSIADNQFKIARRYVELALELAVPSVANLDSAIDARNNINRLRRSLSDDAVALCVLEDMLTESSLLYAQERLHLDFHVYWAKRKRISREAVKLARVHCKGKGK